MGITHFGFGVQLGVTGTKAWHKTCGMKESEQKQTHKTNGFICQIAIQR